ncbi:MAG: ATP-dependent DNA helicase, partial [Lachnospiraceae bacterium]|nr:ATP-dependent DNA helicase [Lachnospiraceae bacterium]
MENQLAKDRYQIRISVRDLVEFVLSSGDIDNRRTAGAKKEAMQEGSRLHRKIQRRMGASYQAEVTMRHVVEEEQYQILVEGRADGVITEPGGSWIDEIKCIYMDLSRLEEPVPVHMAQAMCYGYFWCLEKELPSIGLQLTYCNIETEEIKRFQQEKSFEELKEWFLGLVHEYLKWAEYQYRHHLRRQESLKALEFPYPYRKGQKELAVDVYRTIVRSRNLYIQAPTGIGKTLSTVFPSLKAMGEGHGDKLFYLTAKTVTRRVAEEALEILRGNGLYFSSVTITAKEKLCILDTPECNPDACPYAKGHYDRVNDAVFDIIHEQFSITREKIIEYAGRYQVCPFEFCLDISNWVDGIICDYNYVFDPNVRLKRYFAEGSQGAYLFLVDEAHNLVSRAREMYSACLVKEEVLLAKRLVKERSPKLARLLESCNKSMLELKRDCERFQVLEEVNHLALKVMEMFAELEVFMEEFPEFPDRDLLLDFYFQARDFIHVFEQMDDGYQIYSQMMGDGSFQVRLFCINPAGPLRACMDQGISTILFSATLLPMPYYKELLSGEPEGYAIYAESPFRQEKRLLLAASDVSSRYTRRNRREYEKAASYIREIVKGRRGNYMVFCPSYQYLGELAAV